ncbi:hypothetical protein L195_g053573, partial [Trifolium pratense]
RSHREVAVGIPSVYGMSESQGTISALQAR